MSHEIGNVSSLNEITMCEVEILRYDLYPVLPTVLYI